MRTQLLALLLLLVPCLANADPTFITRAQWGSKPLPISKSMRHTPTLLTLHHSGVLWKEGDDPYVKIRALQSWGQKEKGWPDLPYHYMIAPGGEIFEGRDWHYRPESNTKYNLDGVLNLELWGNFDEQKVTLSQLTSLVELLAYLYREHKIKELRGHGDAAPGQTHCPGEDLKKYLNSGQLLKWVQELQSGRKPRPTLNVW